MNRVFHARILPGHYLALGVFAYLLIHAFWVHSALLALLCMVVLVLVVERIVHTQYTVTADGKLQVDRGRFSKLKEIAPADILRVDAVQLICLIFACINTLVAYGSFTKAMSIWHAAKVSAVVATTPLFSLALESLLHSLWPEAYPLDSVGLLSLLGASGGAGHRRGPHAASAPPAAFAAPPPVSRPFAANARSRAVRQRTARLFYAFCLKRTRACQHYSLFVWGEGEPLALLSMPVRPLRRLTGTALRAAFRSPPAREGPAVSQRSEKRRSRHPSPQAPHPFSSALLSGEKQGRGAYCPSG